MKNIKVKVCGLKSENDIITACENGADFIGFVFFSKSPRNIEINDAAQLAKLARKINPLVQICAVTVNPDDKTLNDLKESFAPDYIQLHGSEDIARTKFVQNMGFKIIKAFGVENSNDIAKAMPFFGVADLVLFDAKAPKNSENAGGFGISFDWEILENLPHSLEWILSGGLNCNNVSAAIAATNAPIVDVSSGIERTLGIKDALLIATFIKNAKQNQAKG
jgi:phosphoribosylanthranilate isomerase